LPQTSLNDKFLVPRPVRLIHIAPELPPTVGGVADYTAILSRRLVELSDGAVEPVLVHAGKKSPKQIDVEFPIINLSWQCSAAALADTIGRLADEANGQAAVLLEYSGYGYATRGAPLWLARGLQQACNWEGLPLITMFHELYASGPPWTSAFWISPVQRYVAISLAKLCQAVVTNRAKSADWLRRYVSAETSVRVQPVFSNVGEPTGVPAWEEREPYAMVFGGRSTKQRLYEALRPLHLNTIRHLGIRRLVDVGSPGVAPKAIHGVPIEEHGIQPAKSISAVLSNARVGLLHYPVDYLTKSGIWSSYMAHGVIPLIVSPSRTTEMVHEGQHFIRLSSGGQISTDEAVSIHQEGHAWYQTHAHTAEAARSMLDLMRISNPVS